MNGQTADLNEKQISQFVAYGYATDAMKFARFDCKRLSTIGEIGSMEWLTTVTSLVVHYGRPFKRSERLPSLDEDFVPPKHLELHRHLLQARDKAHAHLDGNFAASGSGSLYHTIRLVKQIDGQHFWCPVRALLIEPNDIPSIAALIESLLSRLDKETASLEQLLLPKIGPLGAGFYLLTQSSPFIIPDSQNHGLNRLEDVGPIN